MNWKQIMFNRTLIAEKSKSPFYLWTSPESIIAVKQNIIHSSDTPKYQVLVSGRCVAGFGKVSDLLDHLNLIDVSFTWVDSDYEKLKDKVKKSGHNVKVNGENGEILYQGKRVVFINGEWCAYTGTSLLLSHVSLEGCLNAVIDAADPMIKWNKEISEQGK